jgi:hypothetical protein
MESGQDFVPVKILPAPILLDDQGERLFYPFIGCKPAQAMGTFPPAADHIPFFAQARVNDSILHMLAEWATQFGLPFPSRKKAFLGKFLRIFRKNGPADFSAGHITR